MSNTPTAGASNVGVTSLDLLAQADAIAPQAATSVAASFGAGILSVFGDSLDNSVAVGRNAAGELFVNNGAVPIQGGTPTVANTSLIQVFGQAGNDTITIDETNGAMPRANLFGGSGNDTITGGSGADQLFGQADNDTLQGRGGNDLLFGGDGNDVLTGGDADDQMFGEAGNDRMIWNPGDDDDLMEGGAGTDTAEVNGGNGAEQFTVTANGARVRFDRIDPAPFSIDIGTTENLVVNMNGGDDSFAAASNLSSLISLTVDGGAGNDTILGGNGADVLLGGDGNDFIDGNQGNDVAFLGAGEDAFQWDPGDGSDVVEGQGGNDRMIFNGSGANETFRASANGERVRFTRDIANIVMDLNDVERIDLAALGGTDTLTVDDLSGTDVTQVNVDLAATIGGTGDGAADTVISNATNGADVITVSGSGTSVAVTGLAAQLNISNSEGANDALVINGLGGNDQIIATTLPAGVVKLTIDGGAGDDRIFGSQGADIVLGGDGNDFVFGDNGDDTASLGAGDDVFVWAPGDGNDTVEGQDGTDTLVFDGANVNENIDISANGGRAIFFRDVANVTMDLNDVERIDFQALGGADNVVVGDLSGTDVSHVAIDLAGANGGGDGAADTVTVNATQGAETFGVASVGGDVVTFGLPASVTIANAEGASDRLVLNGLAGDDVIDASSLAAGAIQLTMNGGQGADTFLGSAGDDLIVGGAGNDVALMGAGNDTFVWNPGDANDVLEGQAGFDTMLFNGANIAENIDISANGGRVTFFRNVANVTMDLNDTESIDFNALGAADNIFVNDLSGTDVRAVNVNLAAAGGAGDGAADTVIVEGTNGDDVILLVQDGNDVIVRGLAAEVRISGFEVANDHIVINGLAGDDVIEGSGLITVGFSADGGAGDDVLIGGNGDDTLLGGEGDDVLIGGAGTDILDGGPGDDIEIPLMAGDPAALFVGTAAEGLFS
jgi:Ca2+-binding RTX toxin-like protein